MSLLLFLCALVFLYAALKRSCADGLLLSPYSVVVLVSTLTLYLPSVILIDALRNGAANSLIVILLSFLVFSLLVDDSRWLSYRLNRVKTQRLSTPVLCTFAGAYIIYLASNIISLYASSGGVLSMLTRDRIDVYLHEGIKSGSLEHMFLLLPSLAYFILAGKLANERKHFLALCMVLFVSIYHVFTANTRLPIIMPIAAFVCYMLFLRHTTIVQRFGPAMVILSIFVVSLFGFFANLLRHGIFDVEGAVLAPMHEQNLNQLQYPYWLSDLVAKVDSVEIPLNYGITWLYTPFLNLIPRVLWSEKPLTSTSNILSEKVYGISVGDGSPITTFTIWGEAYWQLGLFGVFSAVFIFYYLFKFIVFVFTSYKDTELLAIYTLINWIPFVRAEMPVFFVITNFVGIFLLVVLSSVLRKQQGHA